MNIPIDTMGKWVYNTFQIIPMKKGKEMGWMDALFGELLRSNFRCGRMPYSRTSRMAGCFAAPILPL